MFHSNIYCTLSAVGLTILVLLACTGSGYQGSLYSNKQKFKIPDVIPITSSTGIVKVQLDGNTVNPGDQILAGKFRNLDFSKISWDYNNMETKYTLMLLDLDRKPSGVSVSNSTISIYNQYTNINILGDKINTGQTVTAFDAPNVPCQPSTKHRLVLLVFHQAETIEMTPSLVSIWVPAGPSPMRENFKLEDFISQHRLDLVAANIILALGESGGVCSGTTSIMQTTITSIILLMVMLAATLTSAYSSVKRHHRHP